MNLTDPSLYGVTYPQREIGTPFMGALPIPWQNLKGFVPPYAYGMQSVYPYGMQPFLPFGQFGAPPQLYAYGTQPFLPPAFGYTPPPFPALPIVPPAVHPLLGSGACGVPFNAPMQTWQRPFWY